MSRPERSWMISNICWACFDNCSLSFLTQMGAKHITTQADDFWFDSRFLAKRAGRKEERSLCLCPCWLLSSNSSSFLFDISLLLLLVGCQPVLSPVDLDQGWPDPVRTFCNPAGFSVYQGETAGFLYPPGRSDNPAAYSSYGPGLDTSDLEGEQMYSRCV